MNFSSDEIATPGVRNAKSSECIGCRSPRFLKTWMGVGLLRSGGLADFDARHRGVPTHDTLMHFHIAQPKCHTKTPPNYFTPFPHCSNQMSYQNFSKLLCCISTLPNPHVTPTPPNYFIAFPPCPAHMSHQNLPQILCMPTLPHPNVTPKHPPITLLHFHLAQPQEYEPCWLNSTGRCPLRLHW